MIIRVYSADRMQHVDVEVDGINEVQYQTITDRFKADLKTESSISQAVANAFLNAIDQCPNANPADLWWHVIYRTYLSLFSDQSWKRTAGFALERVFVQFYTPLFEQYGIRIQCLPGGAKALNVIREMRIEYQVGRSKIDVILEGKCEDGNYRIFGGVHVKSSLAERIQDDVPASLRMIEAGYWSGFLTLDAKAFPPPHGDAVVRGELGFRSDPEGALKRNYFERDGQFDDCYSYNLRTIPSSENTPSGKKIYTLSFNDPKPDQFMKDVIERWRQDKLKRCSSTS